VLVVAERKSRAFQRRDGGDSTFLNGWPSTNANEPAADTPTRF
jgi:hypothetical protein